MIPPAILFAAARDSVLTALLHLHERGTRMYDPQRPPR